VRVFFATAVCTPALALNSMRYSGLFMSLRLLDH